MNAELGFPQRLEHGELCSCKLLAAAVGMDPRELSYAYCLSVLQKRWRLTCNHGEIKSTPGANGRVDRWRDVGQIDPVKAILMSNDQIDP